MHTIWVSTWTKSLHFLLHEWTTLTRNLKIQNYLPTRHAIWVHLLPTIASSNNWCGRRFPWCWHQLQLLSDGYDKHEMHSRRKVLLVHGLPEEASEQVESKISDLIHNQLKLPSFEQANIDVCHRLGVKADKRRPILIRFSNLKAKTAVWKCVECQNCT